MAAAVMLQLLGAQCRRQLAVRPCMTQLRFPVFTSASAWGTDLFACRWGCFAAQTEQPSAPAALIELCAVSV